MTGIASSVVWQVPLEGRGSWFVLESLRGRVHYAGWLSDSGMCEGFPTTQLQTCSPGRAETLTQFPAYLGCSSLAESFPRGGWGDIPSARVATQNVIVYPAGFHSAPHIRSLLLVHFKAAFFSLRGLLSVGAKLLNIIVIQTVCVTSLGLLLLTHPLSSACPNMLLPLSDWS